MYKVQCMLSLESKHGILTKVAKNFIQELSWKALDTKVNKTKLPEGCCRTVFYIKWIKVFQNWIRHL